MTKVMYNGDYIELDDELEPGYQELDLLSPKQNANVNDVLDNTMQLERNDLEDTVIIELGDYNE